MSFADKQTAVFRNAVATINKKHGADNRMWNLVKSVLENEWNIKAPCTVPEMEVYTRTTSHRIARRLGKSLSKEKWRIVMSMSAEVMLACVQGHAHACV